MQDFPGAFRDIAFAAIVLAEPARKWSLAIARIGDERISNQLGLFAALGGGHLAESEEDFGVEVDRGLYHTYRVPYVAEPVVGQFEV